MEPENENRLVASEAESECGLAPDNDEIHEKNNDRDEAADVSSHVTQSENVHAETDKTDKTYSAITNKEFLSAIFGDAPSDVRPVVVSFGGNPDKVPSCDWFGIAWTGTTTIPACANNYFSLSSYRPDEAGHYRRKKRQFAALCAVMLDDIGTKIPNERITLPPSWRIETSPDNFQIGYILDAPLTDGAAADRLMNVIIAAGLCDPGANGPTARLARLPGAVNGKYTPSFACRARGWNPERRYSVEALVDGLQLEMRSRGRQQPNAKQKSSERPHDDDPILIPRPTENVVITALRVRGLYKKPLGYGKHDITCPWMTEHTGAIDGGTAYFEPDGTYPIGGFKCQHGHCANRHISSLLGFLDIERKAARMKAVLRVVGGEIHRIVDVAEQELSKSGKHYQRGGLIVIIYTDPGTRETVVRPISQPALTSALAGVATFERFDKRAEEWVCVDPPTRHVSVLFDSMGYTHLPVLNGLARQPYLRPDETLATTAGHDLATGIFGVFAEKDFSVPDQPTKEQAKAALLALLGLLAEFSFTKPSDLAAALSAILTAAIRSSLPLAPMFHVRAPQIASGKSYLCSLIIAFASPQRGAPSTFPQDDEECRKFLLATLLSAPAVVEFDNMTGDLVAYKSLCAALTSEYMTGRILGISKTATVNTRTMFLSSGNNVGPVQDMARRCVTIALDPACEMPATREFKNPNLVPDVLRERGRHVSAALTIIRAWIVAGRPKTVCKALAGYEIWSDLCRQSLLWLEQADPAESVFTAMSDDPDRDTLGRLLNAWYFCFGRKPTMVREAVNREAFSEEGKELREVLNDIALERDGINRRSLGRWIKRHSGRIVNGLRFVRASGSRSAEAWVIKSVL